MGGIGKSVLSAAVAWDDDIRCAFPDGVFWLTLGQEPTLLARQTQLAEALGERQRDFTDLQQGKARLSDLLAETACLLILDDVWAIEHVQPFLVLGPRCRLLITTRDARLIIVLGARDHRLEVLNDTQALELLAQWAGQAVSNLPIEAHQVAQECGNLPLALAMIGAMVQKRPDRWGNALHKLRNADLGKIRQEFPNYPYPDLLRAMQVSVEALEPNIQTRYLDFSVFPDDTPIPEAVVATYWEPEGLDRYDVQDVVDILVDRSLLRRNDEGHVTMHDLQVDYVRKQAGDLAIYHDRLLQAYASRCSEGWWSGPNDGYFFENLLYHMVKAGHYDNAKGMLLNYNWLDAKLRVTSVSALAADCAAFPGDRDVERLKGAIHLSAWAISRDTTQLGSQLFGRLSNTGLTAIESLRQSIVDCCRRPWLRPHTASLAQSGGPLQHLLEVGSATAMDMTPDGRQVVTISGERSPFSGEGGNSRVDIWNIENDIVARRRITWSGWPVSGFVKSIIVSSDGKRAVACPQSVSRGAMAGESRLACLDLEEGIYLGTMNGCSGTVDVIVMTVDGQYVITATNDSAIQIWSWERRACLHVLAGHSRKVNALAVTSDQRCVISASDDGTLKIWDIRNGMLLHTLAAREVVARISIVAITSDAKLAISGTTETQYHSYAVVKECPNLYVWNVDTGALVHSLIESPVCAIAVDSDRNHLFSGSLDKTVKVWDIKTGCLIRTLRGHDSPVTTIGVSSDGRRVITVSQDNSCKIWNPQTGDLINSFSNPTLSANIKIEGGLGHSTILPAFTLRMTERGPIAASLSDADLAYTRRCRIWNLEEVEESAIHGAKVTAVTLTSNGRYAVSAADDRALRVWNVTSGDPIVLLQEYVIDSKLFYPKSLAFNSKGNQIFALYTTRGDTWRVLAWDVEKLTMFESIDKTLEGGTRSSSKARSEAPCRMILPEPYVSAQFHHGYDTSDEPFRMAVTANSRYAVIHHQIHNRTCTELHVCDLENGDWKTLRISDSYNFIMNETVHGLRGVLPYSKQLWDLEVEFKQETLLDTGGMGDMLMLLADGRQALCDHRNDELCIQDLLSKQVISKFHGHHAKVNAAAVSIEEGLLTTVSSDGTLKVWDISTGDCINTFTSDASLTCVTCAGRLFIAGSANGAVHIVELVGGLI